MAETSAAEPLSALTRRIVRRIVPLVLLANLAGVAVVFVSSTLAAPAFASTRRHITVLGAVTLAYLVLVMPFGAWRSVRTLRLGLRPLYEDRTPTPVELRGMLTVSARQMGWVGLYWTGAAVAMGGASFALGLPAWVVARTVLAILLGGLTTCTLGFLLSERISRPLRVAGMAGAPPEHVLTPGIRLRLVATWAMGSGIPLLAIALGLLGGSTLDRWRLIALGATLALGGLLAGGAAVLILASAIAGPLVELRRAMRRVRDGDLDVAVSVSDATEIGGVQAGFNEMVRGLQERERLRDLFGRHVGIDVARHALERSDVEGETRTASVLFVDVVGSTALAEQRPPREVVAMLNAMFEAVVRVTADEGGLVNKFEGDAALCVFGAPVDQPDHALHACRAARHLHAALCEVAQRHAGLRAAIGVSSGHVVAGNVGAEARYEYTVIGDAVNEAARLTEAAKGEAAGVLASAAAVESAGEETAHWLPHSTLQLRGRSRPTRVFVPLSS